MVSYHGVLQQVLQFAQSAVLVAGILSLYGVLKLAEVRLTVPRVAHELQEEAETFLNIKVEIKPGGKTRFLIEFKSEQKLNLTWK